MHRSKLTRRGFLKGLAVAAAAPWRALSQPFRLRVLGLPESLGLLPETLQDEASRATGLDVEFVVAPDAVTLAATISSIGPGSFTLVEVQSGRLGRQLWPTNAFQPLDVQRLRDWPQMSSQISQVDRGDGNPFLTELHVQPDGSLGGPFSGLISMSPGIYHAEAFGWLAEGPERLELPVEPISWGELVNPAFGGRVALQADPLPGVTEAVLIGEALGLRFRDRTHLSREEIETLFDQVLIPAKRAGQFRAFWLTTATAVDLLRRGVALEPLSAPGWVAANALGQTARYAFPDEGYRGTLIGWALSSQADAQAQDAAYAFLNWWNGGEPLAMLVRFGYYTVLPRNARRFLSEAEWAFFWEGQPAPTDITIPDNPLLAALGEGGRGLERTVFPAQTQRDGGSHDRRMRRVTLWNTVHDENELILRKWNELLRA